jgi:hypothetical protein
MLLPRALGGKGHGTIKVRSGGIQNSPTIRQPADPLVADPSSSDGHDVPREAAEIHRAPRQAGPLAGLIMGPGRLMPSSRPRPVPDQPDQPRQSALELEPRPPGWKPPWVEPASPCQVESDRPMKFSGPCWPPPTSGCSAPHLLATWLQNANRLTEL